MASARPGTSGSSSHSMSLAPPSGPSHNGASSPPSSSHSSPRSRPRPFPDARAAGGQHRGGGRAPRPPGQPPTNLVTYRKASIKALIDPTLPVQDVIRQLCANAHLNVQEPPALFALRDEVNDELITDENLPRKIEQEAPFKLVSSPTIEAVEMVEKLTSRDEKALKIATYTLQKFIREREFAAEFIVRDGVSALATIIRSYVSGNTLAYALTSCQNLMETMDHGWEVLDGGFIAKVVNILVTQERINVCRPATAILKKLVVSGPENAPSTPTQVLPTSLQESTGVPEGRDAVYRFGFETVYREIQAQPAFLSTLVGRLNSADTTLCLQSLSLINSLMRHVSDNMFDHFSAEVERLGVSRAVARLMDSPLPLEELTSVILDYQACVIRFAHRRMTTPVVPAEPLHAASLNYIWLSAAISDAPAPGPSIKVTAPSSNGVEGPEPRRRQQQQQEEEAADAGARMRWRRLGFGSEAVGREFGRTGTLGLECLEGFVKTDKEAYAKVILEQVNRPEERRCPFARASIEVTEILADHWDIETGYTTATVFLPFLLSFQKIHYMALRFFLRMWNESGAASSDFPRVSALVRSQVKEALRNESSKSWFDVEREFLDSEYRTVRDRQLKELEIEDDFSSKASIRNLRGRLYRESYEFVRQQRIQCLLEGAWFFTHVNPKYTPARKPNLSVGTARMWRFYRLSPNKKILHFCECLERIPIRGGLEDLPEKIDLSLVTDVALPTSQLTQDANGPSVSGGPAGPNQLSFSLLSGPEVSLADLTALTASQFSEWTDGLNMLRGEEEGGGAGGVVSTKETAEFIQILTEIGVKVKLLDLGGERIEVPTSIPTPPMPLSTNFFFAEL